MKRLLYGAILTGGRGRRLWPLGRKDLPKPFLKLLEEKTLLLSTWERLLPVCPAERILVIGGREQRSLIQEELPDLPAGNLLLEPVPRNTAAAVAMAAIEVRKRTADSLLLVTPSDHHIRTAEQFHAAVKQATSICEENLVTFGVRPTVPEAGFGYIRAGEPLSEGCGFRVLEFIEKPSRDRAGELFRDPKVYWNCGIFLWRPERILEAIRAHMPGLGKALEPMEAAIESGRSPELDPVYQGLADVSVDRGVLEKAGNVAVFPVGFTWSDLGSWTTVGELLPDRKRGNRSEGRVVALDSRDNLVFHPDGLTALIGVRDLVVVYIRGALLVFPRHRDQEVRRIVEILEREGIKEHL